MAEIVWLETALADLDAIADCIAIDDAIAAAALVRGVFAHVEQLVEPPESGSRPQALKRTCYRHTVEPPCRVFYRLDGQRIVGVHVMRSERLLQKNRLWRL
ncbi:plasmid stabilization protein [Xanthomonas populi]|uniref:Plasmid stabilization protein n=1 Tax=Xanthomonas populi TaxID=53414 RepID=A0A2S7EN45_9XANT|nr:type II toxin-antitoxin system RelE/ParE family toxin [Xanthomonas populi]PPU92512.1 plasmid stabilization protein [Xanthomonas populi]